MKYKVVGWTYYESPYKNTPVTYAKTKAVIEEIKEKGYFFSGEDHQERDNCVPVFNDGSKGIFSRRGFAACMAEAHGYTRVLDYARFTDRRFIARGRYPQYASIDKALFKSPSRLAQTFKITLSEEDYKILEEEKVCKILSIDKYDYLDIGDKIRVVAGDKSTLFTVRDLNRDRIHDDEYREKYRAMTNFDQLREDREKAVDIFYALPVYLKIWVK